MGEVANYRKIYIENTKLEIPPHHIIHHLNGNHRDNDISNLICIQSFIHRNYHKLLLKSWEVLNGKSVFDDSDKTVRYTEQEIESIKNIIETSIKTRDKALALGYKEGE